MTPKNRDRAQDIRPTVGVRGSNRGIWLFGAAMMLLATMLFMALENRRAALSTPTISSGDGSSADMIAPPLPLAIPEEDVSAFDPALIPYPRPAAPTPSPVPPRSYLPSPYPLERARTAPATLDPDTLASLRASQSPSVATAPAESGALADPFGGGDGPNRRDERVRATRFANPATTVPKGTVVQAVLETALDSTRPGFARAIVSRDIYGFDGSQILIPRGSRLIGDYKADLQPGQKRALIQWQRLMRPDGVIINLDSPSADPLGRAGVEGKVNSHFIARFGGSILQSALNVGAQVAVNQASNGNVIYAIPLPTQTVPGLSPEKVQPTVKVKQGTSVSVFVARDLDFSTVSP